MKKRTTLLIILIFLSLLPFVSYMIGGDLVLHTNIRYSLDPSSFIKDSIHAWSDDNFGRASGSGFTNIIQSAWFLAARSLFWFRPEIVQALILGIFNLIGAIGFILFVRNHFREKIGMLPMLIGSIFFLFNGYTLTYVASAPNFAIIYLIMPWQLFLFERCLQKETTRERLLPIVLLAFVNQLALWVNLVYFFMVFFVQLFLGILYVVRSETSVAKLISVKILVWIISIAMMSWWLLPQIYGGYADPVSSANTLSSEGFYNGDSGPLNIFRNLGYWGFFSGSNGEPYYDFSKFYRSGIMVLVTMIPIMLLIAGLLLERVRKNTQYLAWLSLLFLIFPFVGGINSNWPTAELMRWCFDNIPMFSIFRNTHKWMALVVLAESILMVFLCHNIIGKNDRAGKLFSVAAIVILVAGAWPFFSGRVIQPATVIEKIPDDWTRIADVINQDESIDRLMLLPDQYGEVYDWQGTRTKIPGSLGGALFATPVVHSTCKGCLPAYSEHLVNFVYKSFGEKDHDKFIGQLGISHILQRDDYAYEYYHKQSPKEIRDMLSIYPSIELGTSSGNLALFKVDEKLVNPKIYSPAALTVADSLDTYLDSLGFAYQTRQRFMPTLSF